MATRIMLLLLSLFLVTLMPKTAKGFEPIISNQINLLRQKSGSHSDDDLHGFSCLSWRLAVETNNIIDWTVPKKCEDYVGHYMLGGQYRKDSKIVCKEAFLYAKSLNLTKNGNYVWVFDVDDTVLSNLPYYASHGFGANPFNVTAAIEWTESGEAPALPESLKLYNKLISLGIKIVFLTGRRENKRSVTEANLKAAGFVYWEKLILRGPNYENTSPIVFKSAQREKLEAEGYKIIGIIGDQWSKVLGTNTGNRTFKLPNPMYYIG